MNQPMTTETETVADVVREWHVTDCGACIRSRDFAHDVVLNLSGDFADTDERITYAEHIANTLNSEAAHARELGELRKDAARYRCYRATTVKPTLFGDDGWSEEDTDRVIDAAMSKQEVIG